MQVRAFKLINGDEIIAELVDQQFTNSKVSICELKRPLHLRAQMTPGGPQLGFFPWAMMLDENTTFNLTSDKWFAEFEPSSEITADYIKNVTGIDIISSPTQILHS